MQAYRIETRVMDDGKLVLDALPFQAGERVEVIVLAAERATTSNRYPLRGMISRYDRPMDPVAEDDWEANQ